MTPVLAGARKAVGRRLRLSGGSTDMIDSQVAMPYTRIPATLVDYYRLRKQRGHTWISLHPLCGFRTLRQHGAGCHFTFPVRKPGHDHGGD